MNTEPFTEQDLQAQLERDPKDGWWQESWVYDERLNGKQVKQLELFIEEANSLIDEKLRQFENKIDPKANQHSIAERRALRLHQLSGEKGNLLLDKINEFHTENERGVVSPREQEPSRLPEQGKVSLDFQQGFHEGDPAFHEGMEEAEIISLIHDNPEKVRQFLGDYDREQNNDPRTRTEGTEEEEREVLDFAKAKEAMQQNEPEQGGEKEAVPNADYRQLIFDLVNDYPEHVREQLKDRDLHEKSHRNPFAMAKLMTRQENRRDMEDALVRHAYERKPSPETSKADKERKTGNDDFQKGKWRER